MSIYMPLLHTYKISQGHHLKVELLGFKAERFQFYWVMSYFYS